MLLDRLPFLLLVLGVSILSATAIIVTLSRVFIRTTTAPAPKAESPGAVFLFQGGILTDASTAAQEFLARAHIERPDLGSVTAHLARQFPDLGDKIDAIRRCRPNIGDNADQVLNAAEGAGFIRLHAAHGLIRLTLVAPHLTGNDQRQIDAMQEELQTLRSIAEDAPQLIWKQDQAGQVIWANAAYLRLADRISPTDTNADPLWPSRAILPDLKPVEHGAPAQVQRIPVMLPDQTESQWFEVTSLSRGDGTVHFAIDANSTMAAENGRQKFIQTLSKTFAHLPIGLAIFDRDRRLVLFNPAFLDLTGLQVSFLSAKPLVNSVLDRLRDMNMLPEPKNYTTWRDQVAALEAAAVRGTYCEMWSLPSGRTYRVTGRPQPDGAIAFMFEDISDEVLLTRHYRSELETAQAVLDNVDEGIAVFSGTGTLILSNAVYDDLWGRGAGVLQDIAIRDELTRWKNRSAASQVWDRLRDSTGATHDRARWHDIFRLDDGRSMTCRFTPLPGGAALIGFRPVLADNSRLIPAIEATGTEFRRSLNRPRDTPDPDLSCGRESVA